MTPDSTLITLLGGLVAGECYPDFAPEGAGLPRIVYQQVGGLAVDHQEGKPADLENARMQVVCWAATRDSATTLAKQGHTIIIHGRSRQKTEAALAEIKRESGNPNVEMYLGDFLSLAGVKAFADAIKEKYDHIDVLINNAGAQFTEQREATNEGHEKTMAINVFAPMLLTKLFPAKKDTEE